MADVLIRFLEEFESSHRATRLDDSAAVAVGMTQDSVGRNRDDPIGGSGARTWFSG